MIKQTPPRSLIVLAMLVVPLGVWATLVTLLVPGVYGESVHPTILREGIGQDFVTLIFAIPLTFISIYLTLRGSLRGFLLLLGEMLYFAYSYLAATILYPPNPMFIVHVVIFSAATFALIRGLFFLDAERVTDSITSQFPRKSIAIYLMLSGFLVGLLWIGTYLVPMLVPKTDSQAILGNQEPNLIIQVLDLGIVIPLSILAGILLLRRHSWGVPLAGLVLVKVATLLLAVMMMIVMMVREDEVVDPAKLVLFGLLAVFGLVMLGWYLFTIRTPDDE